MTTGTVVDLSKYIDTQFFGDRPHIRGRRIPVATIVHRTQANNWTITQASYDFSLTEEEVLAAMLYYKEHQALIDQQEAEENARFDQMKQQHGND